MGNRDRNEIIASILPSIINAKEKEGIRTTRIMYNSFLSHSLVMHYLKLLTENGSLEYYGPNKTYKITDKVLRFLELQNEIDEMLKAYPLID